MIRKRKKYSSNKAQTAIEYMLLLAVVVAIVLIMLKRNLFVDITQNTANVFYNNVVAGIVGPANRCGDGVCDQPRENCERCPPDCFPLCPP